MTKQRLLSGLLRGMLLCIFLLFLFPFARAQNKTVTGTVSDDKGGPLSGATIRVKGSSHGVNSDAAGRFSLSVPANAGVLQISYIGYETQEVMTRVMMSSHFR